MNEWMDGRTREGYGFGWYLFLDRKGLLGEGIRGWSDVLGYVIKGGQWMLGSYIGLVVVC